LQDLGVLWGYRNDIIHGAVRTTYLLTNVNGRYVVFEANAGRGSNEKFSNETMHWVTRVWILVRSIQGALCCTRPQPVTIHTMAAIGLLDIPPEIHLQIAEFAETRQTLKALSITSRSLRSIAQSLLFEELRIDLGKVLRGSIDDLLGNPQICAAIRFLELRGQYPFIAKPPRNDEEKLSLVKKILPEMVGLRKVSICQVHLSKEFLDAFLGIAANTLLQITLDWNIYPYDVIPTAHTPLQVSYLDFRSAVVEDPSLEFYRSILHASAATLTRLSIFISGDGIMKLADINLPFLRDFTLSIATESEASRTNVAAFLTAQRAIRKLNLSGKFYPFPPIPPNALPKLRELRAPTGLINQLVPGRPVKAIEVIYSSGSDQDWLGEEVARSTARVRILRANAIPAIFDTQMVKRVVKILPFLESLWLPVFDSVSEPFARSPWLISFRHSSISLKCSLHSSASRSYASICFVAKYW
jgi:hypothetical protein